MPFSAVGCHAGSPFASMGQRGFASLWARIDGTVGVPMWNLEICLTCRVGLLQGFLVYLACERFLFFEVELSLSWRAGYAACPNGYKLRCSGSHFSNSSHLGINKNRVTITPYLQDHTIWINNIVQNYSHSTHNVNGNSQDRSPKNNKVRCMQPKMRGDPANKPQVTPKPFNTTYHPRCEGRIISFSTKLYRPKNDFHFVEFISCYWCLPLNNPFKMCLYVKPSRLI